MCPVNYIGSAIHTPSSSGNTVNKGGIQASDISQNYHIYSMNWSPNQITFLLDDVAYYTYNPSVKNANTWPFDKEQYLLFNVAMGGYAGNIPSNFTQTSMIIDYIRVYQNTVVDNEPPTNFTASVGEVTGSSVELFLYWRYHYCIPSIGCSKISGHSGFSIQYQLHFYHYGYRCVRQFCCQQPDCIERHYHFCPSMCRY